MKILLSDQKSFVSDVFRNLGSLALLQNVLAC